MGISMEYITNNIFETQARPPAWANQLRCVGCWSVKCLGSLRTKSDKVELLWTSQYMYIDIFKYTCIIMHIRPPAEFWKWKKVRSPQVSEKVRPRNQDAILEILPTIFGSWSSKKKKMNKHETNVYKSF